MTQKKNNLTIDTSLQNAFGFSMAPSSDNIPIAYARYIWDTIDDASDLAEVLDVASDGQYTQSDINEAIATKIKDLDENGVQGLNDLIPDGTTDQNQLVNASGMSTSITNAINTFSGSLGTAASTDSSSYATAAQGELASTAVQPGDLSTALSSYDLSSVVNSKIATASADFLGTNTTATTEQGLQSWLAALKKGAQNNENPDKNDYAFWAKSDANGNIEYRRYKYDGTNWNYEYSISNPAFTATQWSAINSGVGTSDHNTITDAQQTWMVQQIQATNRTTAIGKFSITTYSKLSSGTNSTSTHNYTYDAESKSSDTLTVTLHINFDGTPVDPTSIKTTSNVDDLSNWDKTSTGVYTRSIIVSNTDSKRSIDKVRVYYTVSGLTGANAIYNGIDLGYKESVANSLEPLHKVYYGFSDSNSYTSLGEGTSWSSFESQYGLTSSTNSKTISRTYNTSGDTYAPSTNKYFWVITRSNVNLEQMTVPVSMNKSGSNVTITPDSVSIGGYNVYITSAQYNKNNGSIPMTIKLS